MRILLLLILVAAAGNVYAAPAEFSAQGLIPEAGPHAVGLRIVQQYDYSRVLEAPVDAFGKAGNVGPARPIQTLFWYPAKRSAAAHMLVADYCQASLSDVDFSFPVAESAKQRAGWMEGQQKAQYGAATLAVRDAAPEGGSYPVVIYAPSFASLAHENLDLCEYLASHGYVVIASRSLGARSVAMTDDVDSVEAQAADIAFLANYASAAPGGYDKGRGGGLQLVRHGQRLRRGALVPHQGPGEPGWLDSVPSEDLERSRVCAGRAHGSAHAVSGCAYPNRGGD